MAAVDDQAHARQYMKEHLVKRKAKTNGAIVAANRGNDSQYAASEEDVHAEVPTGFIAESQIPCASRGLRWRQTHEETVYY